MAARRIGGGGGGVDDAFSSACEPRLVIAIAAVAKSASELEADGEFCMRALQRLWLEY